MAVKLPETQREDRFGMKRYIGTLAALALAGFMLTGCGDKTVEEGVSLLEEQDYKGAAELFEQAVKKDEEDAEAQRGLGIAKWELEDYEGALSAFESALENGGDKTAEIYNLMGNCCMKLDQAKQALNYYRLGLEEEDASDELKQEMRLNEIAAYEKSGDMESAKSKLKSYIQDYPDDEKAAKEAEFLETR